ncbi:MAG: mucoidy inhibitor MuiA family protein, partial [Treponemataceae bacterium]
MKTITTIALILALAAANVAAAEINETTAPSAINKVIVYSDRAIVERTMTLDLEMGERRLVFDDLPENIEANSLQARGSGKAILQDIVFRTKHYAAIPDDRIQALVAAKEEKDGRILQRTDKVKRANNEKGVLDKIINKATAQREGQDSELSPDKWAQLIKFYSDRLTSLDEEIRATEKEIRDLKLESDRIGQELGRLQAGRQKKKNQAIVVLRLSERSKVSLTLSYLVYGPSWQPVYDLRVNSETERLELSYNANVVQNTGEDWTNVGLALSTARPEIGGSQPDLAPWYLSVLERRPAPRSAPSKAAAPAAAPMAKMYEEAAPENAARGAMKEAAISAESASVVAGAVAVMFDISGNTTIASDNTSHRVSIFQKTFPAAFRYSTVPKLSVHAYLKAKVRNESD